jgi:hypothetical protein
VCEVDDWIHFSRGMDQQRVLVNMPTANYFVGTTYFDSRVLVCVCVCVRAYVRVRALVCVCVCVCLFDIVSLSTRNINQVSVAISPTLKVDYFT